MIYIASPYSVHEGLSPDAAIAHREANYKAVRQFMAEMFRTTPGAGGISPIVLMHELAKKEAMPTDAAYYREFNFNLIRAATLMIVLTLPGWKESKGVQEEINFCHSIKKIVDYRDIFYYSDLKAL